MIRKWELTYTNPVEGKRFLYFDTLPMAMAGAAFSISFVKPRIRLVVWQEIGWDKGSDS